MEPIITHMNLILGLSHTHQPFSSKEATSRLRSLSYTTCDPHKSLHVSKYKFMQKVEHHHYHHHHHSSLTHSLITQHPNFIFSH
mmetsp:Transcript_7027/g.26319  ORF Transcript_7027/g.26319 Transcript_7027/m.26319 type:complete len:84 (+) Transcript_7027:2620-2871(+)